jgi:hypothetical protein
MKFCKRVEKKQRHQRETASTSAEHQKPEQSTSAEGYTTFKSVLYAPQS